MRITIEPIRRVLERWSWNHRSGSVLDAVSKIDGPQWFSLEQAIETAKYAEYAEEKGFAT